MKGALPPSSSPTFFTPDAACRISSLPTSVEPVKPTKRTAGCSQNTLPIAAASPVTMFSTPAGRPARIASSPSASAVSGVSGAGLMTQAQPAASAGRAFAGDHRRREIPRRDRRHHADRLAQGEDARVGPGRGNGLAINALGLLGVEFDEACGIVDLAARLGQRLALLAGHDQSPDRRARRESGRTICASTAPRCLAVSAAQAFCARAAISTASVASAAPPLGTCARTAPVAGLRMATSPAPRKHAAEQHLPIANKAGVLELHRLFLSARNAPQRHQGPDRLDQPERPGALQKAIGRAQRAGRGKAEDIDAARAAPAHKR